MITISKRKNMYAYPEFTENARKAFPYKSMYQITKELNKLLEQVLYENGKTPKKKK